MSNDSAGRTPRSTSGGAPMGSTVAIVVTVVAVLLGFLILRKVNDDGSSGGSITPGGTTTTLVDTSSTVAFTSTTQLQLQKQGTKVQVANASSKSGVAKQMTLALTAEGFDMADATNAAANVNLDVSKISYNAADPNALPVANALSVTLGGIAVEQAPAAPAVESGAFAPGSAVILLLGNDLAGKTIAEIQAASAAPTTTQPQVTAVPPVTT
jgi:hypothetical protein